MHEHQRPNAGQGVRYDCRFLGGYEEAERRVMVLVPAQQPEFRPFMPLEEKMRMVLVEMTHSCCTATPLLTLIASCAQPALARKYFPTALEFMPRPDLAHLFESSPQVDINSIMLYTSSQGRANGAQSYPLLTARGSLIDPDPNRAGLSRGDIERVTMLYPKQRPAPRQATGDLLETTIAKRWWSVPEDHETRPEDIRAWPPGEDGSRTMSYCFENRRSFNFLGTTFAEALAKWKPAVDVSSLVFAPDPACKELACLCTATDVAEVTLHIILAADGEKAAFGTLGYRDRIVEKSDLDKPRHYLMWPADTGQIWGTSTAVVMAHELGKTHRRKASKMGPRDDYSVEH